MSPVDLWRWLEAVAALLLLVLLLPLLTVISIWIVLESRGPVMVRRPMALQDGRVAYATEFRLWRSDIRSSGANHDARPDTVIGGILGVTQARRLPRLLDVRARRMSLLDVFRN